MSWCTAAAGTASGVTTMQVAYSSRRGSRDIAYIGSSHVSARLEVVEVEAPARQARRAAEPATCKRGSPAPADGGCCQPVRVIKRPTMRIASLARVTIKEEDH